MRYLQSHSRAQFKRRRQRSVKRAANRESSLSGSSHDQEVEEEEEEEEDAAGWSDRGDAEEVEEGHPDWHLQNLHHLELFEVEDLDAECERQLDERDVCVVFLCGDEATVPHQLGFQRLRSSDLRRPPRTLGAPEKVIDFRGHVIGMSLSPDERFLFVNVRAWPAGAVPALDQPPPIATTIDMHEIDLETLKPTGRVSRPKKNSIL